MILNTSSNPDAFMIQCECCRARVKANTGNSRSGLALVCHCPGQGCGRHVVRLASSPSRAAIRKEQKLRRGVYHCRARSHSPSRGRHPQPRGCRGAEGHTLRVRRAPAAERGPARPHDGRGPAGRGAGLRVRSGLRRASANRGAGRSSASPPPARRRTR